MRVARPSLLSTLLALTIFAAACGSDGDSTAAGNQTRAGTAPESHGTSNTDSAQRRRAGTKVTTRSSRFGTVLVNVHNQTIYLFDKEGGSHSKCYGDCAAAWPPVFANGTPRAAGKVRAGKLGTTKRSGGRRQVTYNGHPLYYYAHESAGQILCQNVSEFGGLWLLVKPGGGAVR
jgi:predicted lipoprotein with Yx(FWY)xxD motif